LFDKVFKRIRIRDKIARHRRLSGFYFSPALLLNKSQCLVTLEDTERAGGKSRIENQRLNAVGEWLHQLPMI
jgi:hypothetical protein